MVRSGRGTAKQIDGEHGGCGGAAIDLVGRWLILAWVPLPPMRRQPQTACDHATRDTLVDRWIHHTERSVLDHMPRRRLPIWRRLRARAEARRQRCSRLAQGAGARWSASIVASGVAALCMVRSHHDATHDGARSSGLCSSHAVSPLGKHHALATGDTGAGPAAGMGEAPGTRRREVHPDEWRHRTARHNVDRESICFPTAVHVPALANILTL